MAGRSEFIGCVWGAKTVGGGRNGARLGEVVVTATGIEDVAIEAIIGYQAIGWHMAGYLRLSQASPAEYCCK